MGLYTGAGPIKRTASPSDSVCAWLEASQTKTPPQSSPRGPMSRSCRSMISGGAGVPSASLVQIAEADALQPSLKLARREALWAITGLRDQQLPLFAAASAREAQTVPELHEPMVALRPMSAGGEVVEDYGHVALTLRAHPVTFLRADLRGQRIVTCAEAMQARDGRWLQTAGLVLVRQKPGAAKGVMFVTLEDETGIANLVVWAKTFEKYKNIAASSSPPAWSLSVVAFSVRAKSSTLSPITSPISRGNSPVSASGRPRSCCRTGAVMSSATVAPASILARGSLRGRYHATSPCRIPASARSG